MSTITNNTDHGKAPESQKEGKKVTGGGEKKDAREDYDPASADQGGEEHTPATETSKEEMTGYNELPEQEKVGGA